jgi:hypothetical protein
LGGVCRELGGRIVNQNGLLLLAAGGVVYSVGGYLYIRKAENEPVSQAAYVCALLGTALHYFAIYFYVHPSECAADTMTLSQWLPAWMTPWL